MTEPKWLTLAQAELGTKEVPGREHNPKVVAYFRDAGHPEIRNDETPWCAAFVGAMLKRSGVDATDSLLARSYLDWGVSCEPRPGAIVVFPRGKDPTFGHVAFVLSVSGSTIRVLGGNQHDCVCVENRTVREALDFRWPDNVVEFPVREAVADTEEDNAQETDDTPPIPTQAVAKLTTATTVRDEKTRLREAGSRTINSQDNIEAAVGAMAGLTAFTHAIGTVPAYAWVGLFLLAAYVFWHTQRTKSARAEDSITGKHTAR